MAYLHKRQMGLHASVALAALFAGGCQPAGVARYAPAPYPAYDYSQQAPGMQAPQAAMQPAPYAAPAYQALEAATLAMKDRLERVEKAMLRLDRRMQLVERNELSRMGGRVSSVAPAQALQGGAAAVAESDVAEALQALDLAAPEGYRPVASRGEAITSALQAAPSLSDSSYAPSAPVQVASRGGLPSLADPAQPQARHLKAGTNDVAIWTVNYSDGKIWPERTQLPASRQVVDVLRENGKANIYARGKNASAVQFRERVKALSRYLSKVSSLDTVPIAAMAAPHLDEDTIEIVVTH